MQALGPEAPETVSLDGALARAQTLYPDFVSTYVSLPEHHGAPIVFHGHRGELLATLCDHDRRRSVLRRGHRAPTWLSDAPLLNRIGAMVNPLHYGDFGGLWSKTVWFVFGLALSSLAVTGVVIFWCRTVQRRGRTVSPLLLRAFHPWRGAMGWFKPLNWAVLALSIVAAVMTAAVLCQPARRCAGALCAAGDRPMAARRHADRRRRRQQRAARAGRPAVAVVDYCPECWHGDPAACG